MPEQLAAYRTTREEGSAGAGRDSAQWTFLTNHAHVLLCLAADPDARVRDVAERVGITERATLRILRDLVEAGYVRPERIGRRNHYRLQLDVPMRHPMERSHRVGQVVRVLLGPGA